MRHYKFYVYKDKKEEWRFSLKATNGEIIVWSEGYSSKDNCLYAIDLVKKQSRSAIIQIEGENTVRYNLFQTIRMYLIHLFQRK